MNWIYEILGFCLTLAALILLALTGVTWSKYPWELAAICVCLILLNVVGYKQGVEHGTEITRSACTSAINDMFNVADKK